MRITEISKPWGGRVHCGEGLKILVRGSWQWGRLETDSQGEVYFVLKEGTARMDDVEAVEFIR